MKKVLSAILIAMVMLLTVCGTVLADDPTTVTINWSGSGSVGGGMNSGDSSAGFNTGGMAISGTFTATDSNNNPYNYTVDSFSSYLIANVTNGGIQTVDTRINSYVPMYGAGGQQSWSGVQVGDGTASMAYRSTTNFAAMVDATYGYQLPGGHNIVVNAGSYQINRGISDGRGDQGFIVANGTGSATLDCMSTEASGVWNLAFGRGAGCYTDASFTATGAGGQFAVTGVGNDSVVFPGMGISSGGGDLSVIANWVNSFNINDYSLIAH